MMNTPFNILDYGAIPDARTDNTNAIQKAIDAAEATGGSVYVPAGTFLCSTVHLKPHVGMIGDPTWSFRESGGAILTLADDSTACLIDLTGAYGATVSGLCLNGNDKAGDSIHGIMVSKPDYGDREDTPRIERCRISDFSGDGIHLDRIWCFSVRHNMVAFNSGNGLSIRGWDGFILDNWFSGNAQSGIAACFENASCTITGNRIEWNRSCGIEIHGGVNYNLTGNYIDRSGNAGIKLVPRINDESGMTERCRNITVTGNMIYRSGRPEWRNDAELESCHLFFDSIEGVVCTGNTMTAGRDDRGKGTYSPTYGIVCRDLRQSIIKDNTLAGGAITEILHDAGHHDDQSIIRDNIGSVFSA